MKELDTTKLLCPLPVIRLGEYIEHMKHGEQVKVLATDRGVTHDIPAWCNVHNHRIISIENGDIISIIVEK